MPVGQGHETFTRYASKRGVNPIAILAPATEAETGALAWAATRVKIARVGDSDRSLIMFAGEMREHPTSTTYARNPRETLITKITKAAKNGSAGYPFACFVPFVPFVCFVGRRGLN